MILLITIEIGTAIATFVVCGLARLTTLSSAAPTASGLMMLFSTTLFSGSLPSETVARVWDSLLVEGPKVHYSARVCY